MVCRLCNWLCERFCGPDFQQGDVWRHSDRWEREKSNDWDLWESDDESIQQANRTACEIFPDDPAQSVAIFRQTAEQGSVWAMHQTGEMLRYGHSVPRDLDEAQRYLESAVAGGSQVASLTPAKLLFHKTGCNQWERPLGWALDQGFAPAAFWHAWFSYKRSRRFFAARENRFLMEIAANAGHPGARVTLTRWKAKGALGLREIPSGLREFRELLHDFLEAAAKVRASA